MDRGALPPASPASAGRHLGLFLGRMLRRPGRIVALSPSSPRLARAMAAGLGPGTGGVIELGAGTGAITRAILARGVPQAALALYEIEPVFADLLEREFPAATVIRQSAAACATAPLAEVGAVVSGLPLLSMPSGLQRRIVEGAFARLRPGGVFVQFTYGLRPPMRAELIAGLGLGWTRSARVWANLPPARVYTFHRAGESPAAG